MGLPIWSEISRAICAPLVVNASAAFEICATRCSNGIALHFACASRARSSFLSTSARPSQGISWTVS
jgi:hypothetical protein